MMRLLLLGDSGAPLSLSPPPLLPAAFSLAPFAAAQHETLTRRPICVCLDSLSPPRAAVGKTSLLHRFVDDNFEANFISTVGIDFRDKTMVVDGHSVKLRIWDTAGQERFRTITSQFYRGSQGILLVYDCSDLKSFQNVANWKDQIAKVRSLLSLIAHGPPSQWRCASATCCDPSPPLLRATSYMCHLHLAPLVVPSLTRILYISPHLHRRPPPPTAERRCGRADGACGQQV